MVAPSSYSSWWVFGFTLLGLTREASGEDAPTISPAAAKADAPAASNADLDLLTFYKDNYFLTGFTGSREVKFQFSAKFDLWPNRGPHAAYFAFSQKSLWNIYRKSQPFTPQL